MNIPVNLTTGSLTERALRVATVARASAEDVDRTGRFPRETIDAMKAEKLFSIQIPVELGGEGASTGEIAELCSIIAQACASSAMIFSMHHIKLSSLVEHGVDVAIRIGRLADSGLGARHLGINPWVLTAAPAYLAARGRPAAPADLSAHACLIYSSVQGDARWLLHAPGGADESVPVRGPLRTNNLSTILAACRAGMGLAMLPWYVARESVVEGHIVPVLQDHALPAQEMHAVFPSPKLVPAKVTGFIAWLQQQLDGPWWTRAF